MKHLLFASSLLLLSACIGMRHGDLSSSARAASIDIRASSPELASRVAASVVHGLPFVEALGNVRIPVHPILYVREVPGRTFQGETYEEFVDIRIGDELLRDGRALDYVVAHELTHYCIGGAENRGDYWRRLPAVMEEGLCELVAQQAEPPVADVMRARYALLTGTLLGGGIELAGPIVIAPDRIVESVTLSSPELNCDTIRDLDESFAFTRARFGSIEPTANREALTGLGFFIARRIGVAGLHRVVDEARANDRWRIPLTRFCEAAKLDPNAKSAWLASVRDLADGKAYDLLLEQARVFVMTATGAATNVGASDASRDITPTDSRARTAPRSGSRAP